MSLETKQDVVLELNFVPKWARKPPSEQPFFFPAKKYIPDFKKNRPLSKKRIPSPKKNPTKARSKDHQTQENSKQTSLPPVIIRFIPEGRPLSAVARKMYYSNRAYPLMQIVSLFLNNPASCRIKIENSGRGCKFFQCGECGIIALSHETIEYHFVMNHLQLFFDVQERKKEDPKGSFICVSRCSLSGVLLGPPNHNSHAKNIDEHRRTRFPNMTDSEYRKHIETVHDPEQIQAWKKLFCHQNLYCLKKTSSEIAPMRWTTAVDYCRKNFAPKFITVTKRASFSAHLAKKSEDEQLKRLCEIAWARERRAPYSLMSAIRAALLHKRFFIFKAGRGTPFITATRPNLLEPSRAIEPISKVLDYLYLHPGCSRKSLIKGLYPGTDPNSSAASKILSPFVWLIEKGHIIEFFDGTLAVPSAQGHKSHKGFKSKKTK